MKMPLQLTTVTKQLKRVMWYPTQTFGYLLFTFFTLCKNVFLYCFVRVCLHAWEISPAQAFFAVGGLSEGVGLPCMVWWVDPSQKPSAQSLFPSSSRRGEKAGKQE